MRELTDFILITTYYYYFYLINEEAEAQRGQATGSGSHIVSGGSDIQSSWFYRHALNYKIMSKGADNQVRTISLNTLTESPQCLRPVWYSPIQDV